jgi:hypothetical protein
VRLRTFTRCLALALCAFSLPDFARGANRSINADFFIWQRQLFTGVSNVAFVATSVPEPGA